MLFPKYALGLVEKAEEQLKVVGALLVLNLLTLAPQHADDGINVRHLKLLTITVQHLPHTVCQGHGLLGVGIRGLTENLQVVQERVEGPCLAQRGSRLFVAAPHLTAHLTPSPLTPSSPSPLPPTTTHPTSPPPLAWPHRPPAPPHLVEQEVGKDEVLR